MGHLPRPEGGALRLANNGEGIRQGSSSPLIGGGFAAAAVALGGRQLCRKDNRRQGVDE
jgi:hypothetical protein